MEIRDSEMSLVFFILYICKMKKNMKEKNQVVPDEVLSKEFISQFKTEADVSRFLKQLHAQVLEKMLEGEMDAHLGYEKNSVAGNNSGNSRNGSYPKKIQTEHGEAVISIPRDRNGQFEPIAVPKHESRGLSIEKLVISLYAKGMSVSDIEEEMREIYEIELSTSAIFISPSLDVRIGHYTHIGPPVCHKGHYNTAALAMQAIFCPFILLFHPFLWTG